jgi:CO/xanthine dehydrogenase FAD-binding subunit
VKSYLPDFEMVIAKDLASALALVDRGFQPFAGGTDIMVLLNAGKLPPTPFVGIRKVPELSRISLTPEFIEFGAAVTYMQIREHPGISAELQLLRQAASWTGSIANQNRGTLGGNIANASPAADSSPVLLVYDAELKLISSTGERWIPYSAFHVGYKSLAMNQGELVGAIRIPRTSTNLSQYGRKVGTRQAQAIAKVSFAAVARVHTGFFRVAVGSVAPIPVRCLKTEEFLASEKLTPFVIDEAKRIIRQEISPITDIRSTRDYRLTVTENLLSEFLESLL